MKTDYEYYQFRVLEVVKYMGEGLLICLVINGLCYQSLPAFLFLLPLPFWYLVRKKRQLICLRRQRLQYQFKDMLHGLETGISAGYSLENAILEAGRDMNRIYGPEQEISRELSYMAGQMKVSIPVEQLFFDLGKRSRLEEIRNFAEILAQSRQMGGNMREVIQKCAKNIEDRIEIRKEIDAMIAARLMEHKIMNLMPAAIIFYMQMTSPGFMDVLYHNAAGAGIMTLLLLAYFGAFFWGRRIAGAED